MKSAISVFTRYFQFSLLIALSLLALPLLRADAIPLGRPSPNQQESWAGIADQQKILRGLHDQIDQQSKITENAREMAVGAGALGDAASVFIDEYVREQENLDELKRDLAPRIRQAEQTLAALQAQQTALSARGGPKSQPVQTVKRRVSPVRKKRVAASGASLETRQ